MSAVLEHPRLSNPRRADGVIAGDAHFEGVVRSENEQITNGGRWFVVHTKPHSEMRATNNLEQQGFHVFCPRVRKTVRHARKLQQVLTPLFPGYLFVQLDLTRDRWRSINGTSGVIRVVTYAEAPCPLPQGIVEALRENVGSSGVMDWRSKLEIGQAVRIFHGPFTELVGTLEKLDATGRVHVLLEVLGRSVSVVMHSDAVAPAI